MVDFLQGWLLRLAPYPVLVLVLTSLLAIFFWVPTDAGLGLSQRIFYYHVPAATSCFIAFAGGGIGSAMYLYTRKPLWDHAAHAFVSVGMLFATIVLVTGSIWARTAWGTWWTWDSRLTTFLLLWLVYASYLLLRTLSRDNEMGPRYAAVLCIVGALNVPLVMLATRLFRTIHPQVINNPQGGISDPRMVTTLMLSMGAEILLMLWLWALCVSTLRLGERVELLSEESYRRSVPS
ncbi:MAG TPA: cytochrome c biogenesis protein CcsA [Candidatus Binatia bacterium]|nr:cytochrome c biogenesis protein CcsA [Candidatus Binatia bacterium]